MIYIDRRYILYMLRVAIVQNVYYTQYFDRVTRIVFSRADAYLKENIILKNLSSLLSFNMWYSIVSIYFIFQLYKLLYYNNNLCSYFILFGQYHASAAADPVLVVTVIDLVEPFFYIILYTSSSSSCVHYNMFWYI